MDRRVREASFGQELSGIPFAAGLPVPMEPEVQSARLVRSDSERLRKGPEDFGNAWLPPLRVLLESSKGGTGVDQENPAEPTLRRVLRTAIHGEANAVHEIPRVAPSPERLHRTLSDTERPSKARKVLPRDPRDSTALQKLASEGSATRTAASADSSALVKRGVSGDSRARVPCELCSATFSQRCHMLCHVRTVHGAARNFQCPRCTSRFSRRAYLREHIAVVHEKRRDHPCPVCGRKFGWKSEVTSHLKLTHGISPKNTREYPLISS